MPADQRENGTGPTSPVRRPASGCGPARTLRPDDAAVLKTAVFACLQMSGWTPDDIGKVWKRVPTETPPARSMINAILRLRIDGRPLFRSVEGSDGSRAVQFDPAEFPDGINVICGALWLRLPSCSACP